MTVGADQERGQRPPTLLDAILPVVVLIAVIALTIVLFGVSAIAFGVVVESAG